MRGYIVPARNQSVLNASGDIDLVEIAPADDKPVVILAIEVDQVGITDIGDAQEEFLDLSIVRGHTTSGSGGSTPVIGALSPNDTAAGFTAEVHNTTPASSGTGIVLWAGAVGVRTPGPVVFGDMGNWWMAPQCSQVESRIVLRLNAAVADDITLSWTMWVAELI